ncbi:MAG TPA: CaiB/BaiF CoA-transferase family protein [Jatrophihabitans sp.]|nr:CaiB/BaiF CoA-transferase family protein [Jatrophihabitans sp.]
MAGPLDGIRVLELGSFIAGPFAGQLLADYGAEVIKIEQPGVGDAMRTWGITRDGKSLWWPAIARNKKSVTVNLRTARGQELVRRLAENCDIVLENFRPGTLDRWGLDYETVSASAPGVIYVHVSGFGQTGPRADEAGFGSVAEAVGGIRYTTGSPDRPPARSGISLGDALASLFSVIGAVSAVHERSRSGRGQEVDVAIYEAVFALMESLLADYVMGGVLRQRSGSVLPGVAPSNVYPTADGEDVVLAANADTVFQRLVALMGRPELATDSDYATHQSRGANSGTLDELIASWTSQYKSAELLTKLSEGGVPAGLINTAATILRDEHFLARDMIVWRQAGEWNVPMNGVVPKFSRTPGSIREIGPELGAHTDAVLTALAGGDADELARLHEDGVV